MSFNTIQYCRENHIPCFTFTLDHTKQCRKSGWNTITSETMNDHLSMDDNGFAILSGISYLVVDLDSKHNPPQEIIDSLMDHCRAIEKTPGGYHFWFLVEDRVRHWPSASAITWNQQTIQGLDLRCKGGIVYCHPSRYLGKDGTAKSYAWLMGDLSEATVMPDEIYHALNHFAATTTATNAATTVIQPIQSEAVIENELEELLNGLAPHRVDDYSTWIKVGMILKHEGADVSLWDAWSSQSSKYTGSQECVKKWRSFQMDREHPLTKATLYYWIQSDQPELFYRMMLLRNDGEFEKRILTKIQADVADVFYGLQPSRYLYSAVRGWFILQPNGTWIPTGSTDIMSIPGLFNEIRRECKQLLERVYMRARAKEDNGIISLVHDMFTKIGTASFLRGVVSFLPGRYFVHEEGCRWNAALHLFAFTNGVLDLRDMSFRQIDPEDRITVTCGYPYRVASSEEKSMVRGFLSKIFPNKGVLDYVLQVLSSSLSGNRADQVFHVFTGAGANGKSCLMDLCRMVFGEYYQTFSVSYLTKDADGKDKPLPEFAAAEFVRMFVTSEPDEKDRFQVSLLKNLTGNEEVTFRGMYARAVTKYVPQFSLLILSNEIPKLSKWDQAIERRMRCVHFPTRFCREPRAENEALRDDTLATRFKEEEGWRYGLLGLFIDSLKERSGPLVMPEEVSAFTDQYMLANNPVGAWLKENYERTGRRDDRIQKTELYRAFVEDTGENKSQKSFSEDMIKCGILEIKSNGHHYYYGIKYKNLKNDN